MLVRLQPHDVLRKIVAYYKNKTENVKNEFLVMIWNCYHFYKQNIEFTRNQVTFKNSHLFKNDKQKNMSHIGTTISIYHNKLQKNCSKIHSYEKDFFWEKDMQSFSKVIILAHFILFAPTYILL
jgi:hypothetical protein